jgi:hypothetical protein
MNYSTTKKIRKIKEKIIDILLYPIRCVGTPIYNYLQKNKKEKQYSEKQIRKTVKYLIDYWTDGEDGFYVLLDDDYNPFDCSNISTPYNMQSNMNWGWNGENRKIKDKASHMYFYQKEQYLNIFKELCGSLMTLTEKEQWFDKYDMYKIKDRMICKVK